MKCMPHCNGHVKHNIYKSFYFYLKFIWEWWLILLYRLKFIWVYTCLIIMTLSTWTGSYTWFWLGLSYSLQFFPSERRIIVWVGTSFSLVSVSCAFYLTLTWLGYNFLKNPALHLLNYVHLIGGCNLCNLSKRRNFSYLASVTLIHPLCQVSVLFFTYFIFFRLLFPSYII